jgi:hypothetical protein
MDWVYDTHKSYQLIATNDKTLQFGQRSQFLLHQHVKQYIGSEVPTMCVGGRRLRHARMHATQNTTHTRTQTRAYLGEPLEPIISASNLLERDHDLDSWRQRRQLVAAYNQLLDLCQLIVPQDSHVLLTVPPHTHTFTPQRQRKNVEGFARALACKRLVRAQGIGPGSKPLA